MYHPRWDHSRRKRRLRGKKVVYRDNPCPRCIQCMRRFPNMSPRSGTPHHFGNHDISPNRYRMVVVANRTRARQASRRDRSHRYRAVCSRRNRRSQHTVAEAQDQPLDSPYAQVPSRPHHRSHYRARPHLWMHKSNPSGVLYWQSPAMLRPLTTPPGSSTEGPTAR